MPAQFIPLAEETGLIVPVGDWVLREACATMKRWHERYPRETGLDLAINLSPRQFRNPNLVQGIDAVLKQTGFDPGHLRLEIAESVLIDNLPSVLRVLNALKEMRIALEIDDFGTGYSCLRNLPLIPCKYLKVDRSFVRKMLEDNQSLEIVRAIIAVAQNLKMNVIAEGIETRTQLDLLRSYCCRFGQGFYLSRPLSAENAERLIERAGVEYPTPGEADLPEARLESVAG